MDSIKNKTFLQIIDLYNKTKDDDIRLYFARRQLDAIKKNKYKISCNSRKHNHPRTNIFL